MRDGEGFMLVYSLTQRSTFIPMARFYEQIKRAKDTTKHVPVVLVGNKVCVCVLWKILYVGHVTQLESM